MQLKEKTRLSFSSYTLAYEPDWDPKRLNIKGEPKVINLAIEGEDTIASVIGLVGHMHLRTKRPLSIC